LQSYIKVLWQTITLKNKGENFMKHAEQTGLRTSTYFSSDYQEARHKFLEASTVIGAKIESFKNPNSGPEGEPLYTDVALIGPKDASAILVLVSGTHGVEGFAGSGIQTALLQQSIASSLKPNMSIVMIHAINPYGFAHLRRFNEDNIDLNRNFVDHNKPYPTNQEYEELANAINPKSISFWSNVKTGFNLFWYRLKNGKNKLKVAISGGQYTHPQGIFYGGQSETWSNKTVRTIVNRYFSNAERVVVVDFHTGLGPYGYGAILFHEKEDSTVYKRAVECWGDRVQNTSGESISVPLQAALNLVFSKMLPNAEVTAVSLEFGTLPAMKVFWALRAENWLHHHGGKGHPDAKRIKDDLLRAFYPDTEDWKSQVWKQGREVVEQALVHLQ
jgi:predicted deacylase